MRRVARVVAAVLVALGAALVFGGAALPRMHRATSEIVVERAAEDVWRVLRDFGEAPRWWPEVAESVRVEGTTEGERWRQVVGGFEMSFDVVEDRPPHRLVTRIVAEGTPAFGGQWVYQLEPEGPRTRVRLTEEGCGPLALPQHRVAVRLPRLDRQLPRFSGQALRAGDHARARDGGTAARGAVTTTPTPGGPPRR